MRITFFFCQSSSVLACSVSCILFRIANSVAFFCESKSEADWAIVCWMFSLNRVDALISASDLSLLYLLWASHCCGVTVLKRKRAFLEPYSVNDNSSWFFYPLGTRNGFGLNEIAEENWVNARFSSSMACEEFLSFKSFKSCWRASWRRFICSKDNWHFWCSVRLIASKTLVSWSLKFSIKLHLKIFLSKSSQLP